jgi:hypothetical protein
MPMLTMNQPEQLKVSYTLCLDEEARQATQIATYGVIASDRLREISPAPLSIASTRYNPIQFSVEVMPKPKQTDSCSDQVQSDRMVCVVQKTNTSTTPHVIQ